MNLFIALEKPGDFNFWFHDFCSILLNVQTKFTEFRLRKLSTNFYVKLEIASNTTLYVCSRYCNFMFVRNN